MTAYDSDEEKEKGTSPSPADVAPPIWSSRNAIGGPGPNGDGMIRGGDRTSVAKGPVISEERRLVIAGQAAAAQAQMDRLCPRKK